MKILLLLLLFSLYACTTTTPMSDELYKHLSTPLSCAGENECKIMWDRAMYFVNTNSGYKVQIANDNMIETYNPSQYSPKLAFRIIKQPLGDGAYKITVQTWCDNFLGCSPDSRTTTARAKRYIRSGAL